MTRGVPITENEESSMTTGPPAVFEAAGDAARVEDVAAAARHLEQRR